MMEQQDNPAQMNDMASVVGVATPAPGSPLAPPATPSAEFQLASLPMLNEWATRSKLSISLISRIMSGQRFPSQQSATKLAGAIGKSVPEFFEIRERVVRAGGMIRVHPVTVTPHLDQATNLPTGEPLA